MKLARTLIVGVLCASCVWAGDPSSAQAASTSFRWQTMLPYLTGKQYRKLRSHLAYRRCEQASSETIRLRLSGVYKEAAMIRVGRCFLSRRQGEQARAVFRKVRFRLLQDYLAFWIGESYKHERKVAKASRSFQRVPGRSLLYRAARLRAAKLWLKENKPKKALAVLRPSAWKSSSPEIWWVGMQAAMKLRDKRGRLSKRGKRLLQVLGRRLWSREPSSEQGKKLKRWIRQRRVRLRLTVGDKVRRAMTLTRIYDYRKALNTLRRVRLPKKAAKKLRCQFYYTRGYAWFRRRSYARAVLDLKKARVACRGDRRLDVRSLYRLGQAYRRRGWDKASARYLRELARRFPNHFLADDALFMIADRHDSRGRKQQARRVYKEMVRKFAKGDMVRVARWRVAFQSYKQGKWEQAIAQFKLLIRSNRYSKYSIRASYYHARAYEKWQWSLPRAKRKKMKQKAIALYHRVVKRYPMHYYSFLALARLHKRTGKRWRIWRAPLKKFLSAKGRASLPKQPPAGKKWVAYLPWGPLPHRAPNDRELLQMFDGAKASYLSHPAYRKGRALYRLGMKEEAGEEWLRVRKCRILFGKKAKKRKRRWGCGRRGDPGAELLALHFHLSESYYQANWAYRGRGVAAGKMRLNAYTVRKWYLGYPQPWAPIVDAGVKIDKVDRSMVYAIMREESAFRPETRSWANAYGLMQFILPTARSTARTLWPRRRITPEDLFQPKVVIRLGVRHLLQLYNIFGQYPLMAGAYNAGPRWVNRWLKRSRRLVFDEWNEAISIKQTRRYVRRVMQSFAIYRLLYLPRRKRWQPAPFSPHKRPAKLVARHKASN